MQLKLYSYFRSSCSWRVRAVLAYKGISYETEGINLIKDGGQQHSEEFKRLNPMEQVPALLVGDRCLTQSISIMEYLEEVYPDPPMLPKDPLGRAKVREICEVIASGIQPLQNLAVLQKIGKDQGEEKKIEWAQEVISKGLEDLHRPKM